VPGKGLEWNWDASKGSSVPDQAYCEKFYNRTADLIKKYQPDLIYFDDTVLPLWPVSDAGLKLAADFYNTNLQRTGGKSEGVLFGKILDDYQRKCLTADFERGVPNKIVNGAWQTDTCIGGWHYSRALYDHNGYKSAATVVHMLADVVSKNGDLLLNIPLRGDGSIDEKEQHVLEGIAAWMDVNKEAIFGTQPWKTFGEGPASEGSALSAQGFNEGKGKPFTAQDIRFTTKGDILYAVVLGVPRETLAIKSLGAKAGYLEKQVAMIEQLGSSAKVTWKQDDAALKIEPPATKPASDAGVVYKITMR
jgi:alpha-L-fucosidase